MSMFIKIIEKNEDSEKFDLIEKQLVADYGYNEAFWKIIKNAIHVYYKNVSSIDHILYA
jgi:hypothetical protein